MAVALKECRELALISKARQQLEAARSVEDVLDIRDKAEALRVYFQASQESLDAMNAAAEIKLRAERRAGEMLAADLRPGRKCSHDGSISLEKLGINCNQSSRWQKMAGIPEAEFDAFVQQRKAAREELTQASLLRLAAAPRGQDAPAPSVDELMRQIERFVDQRAGWWPDDSPQKLGRFLAQLGKKYDDGTKLRFNLIRYPGSKGKLAAIVQRHMPDRMAGKLYNNGSEVDYREPFFGSGAVGLRLMAHAMVPDHSRVWLNDLDPSMAALWTAVRDEPEELSTLVKRFEPSLEAFNRFRAEDGLTGVRGAFQKLALHQMSFSGCGYMGGPIGGSEGSHKNPIGCRWNAGGLMQSIRSIHALMAQFAKCFISSVPWQEVVEDAGENCFMYLDPPYYEKGERLYRYAMTDADHAALADALKDTKADWVLSYDDHPRIRELYAWAHLEKIDVVYSTETRVREKQHELVITPGR